MDGRHSIQGPALASLVHDLGNFGLDMLSICLVFEMANTIATRRVIAHRAKEYDNRTALRSGNCVEESSHINRIW